MRSHSRQASLSGNRSSSPGANIDKLVRNLNRDLTMHEFNLEKIKEMLLNLERLRFTNNTPLIRDLIENITEMRQQFLDSVK